MNNIHLLFSMNPKILEFDYVNYRGEQSHRQVIPTSVEFGTSPHHPEPTWLLRATCLDRKAERTFKMSDMTNVVQRV